MKSAIISFNGGQVALSKASITKSRSSNGVAMASITWAGYFSISGWMSKGGVYLVVLNTTYRDYPAKSGRTKIV